MASITGSVGQGGKNRSDDVRTVQHLLLLNRDKLTPLMPPVVSGVCDAQTLLLIREFQKRVVRLASPDSRVDPGGRTLRTLNEASATGGNGNGGGSSTPLGGEPLLEGLTLPSGPAKVLKEILKSAGIARAKVTSVSRTAYDQARIMYENCVAHGAEYNKNMYASAGDKVIDVYEANKTKPRDTVIELMRAKIVELGPTRVSTHISEDYYTFDVAPSSIPGTKLQAFEEAIRAHKAVTKLIPPPVDPAYHIEIPKNSPHL
ncbi:MAG: hypothetical protein KIT83_09630 [Bryobacterales bacterium]|nr:hypothetical protein [Bryobacterales bacterium]